MATMLIGFVLQSQYIKAYRACQSKATSWLLLLRFMDSTILATSVPANQKGEQPKSVIKGLPEQFGSTR